MKTELDTFIKALPLLSYIWPAIILSALLGACGSPRNLRERRDNKKNTEFICWTETIRCAVYDALVHLVGFFLVPILLLFVFVICDASSSIEKVIVLGILFLPLFFYMIFCLSGRGVEVLHRTIMTGTKSIDITWRGIKIEFFDK